MSSFNLCIKSAKATDRILWLRIWCCCVLLIHAKTSLVRPQVNEISFRTVAGRVGCMLQDMLSVLLVRDAASLCNRFRGSTGLIFVNRNCNLFGLRVCVRRMWDCLFCWCDQIRLAFEHDRFGIRVWFISTKRSAAAFVVDLCTQRSLYSRVSFCDGSFYDDEILQPLSSRTEHPWLVVRHFRNSSVLSLLSALLALFRCDAFLLLLF
jgi:hypothetical protein